MSGLLEKNINKRLCFEQANSHPWIVLIKEKVYSITQKFENDPDKMLCELNKEIITDSYFENNFVVDMEVGKQQNVETFTKQKRKRESTSNTTANSTKVKSKKGNQMIIEKEEMLVKGANSLIIAE